VQFPVPRVVVHAAHPGDGAVGAKAPRT
jgi:hypothetical protein